MLSSPKIIPSKKYGAKQQEQPLISNINQQVIENNLHFELDGGQLIDNPSQILDNANDEIKISDQKAKQSSNKQKGKQNIGAQEIKNKMQISNDKKQNKANINRQKTIKHTEQKSDELSHKDIRSNTNINQQEHAAAKQNIDKVNDKQKLHDQMQQQDNSNQAQQQLQQKQNQQAAMPRKRSLKGIKDLKKNNQQNKGEDEDEGFDLNMNLDQLLKQNDKKTGANNAQKTKQPLKLGQFKFNKLKSVKQNSIELIEEEYYSQMFKIVYPEYNNPNQISKFNTDKGQNNGIDLFEKENQTERNFLLLEMKQLAVQMGLNQKELESQYELFQKMVITQIDDEIEKETDPFDQVAYFNNQMLKTINKHPFFNRYMTILEDFNKQKIVKDKDKNKDENEGIFKKKKINAQIQLKQQFYSQNSGLQSQDSSITRSQLSSSSQFNPNKNLKRKRTQHSSQSSIKMSMTASRQSIVVKKPNKKSLYNPPETFTITDQNCEMTQYIFFSSWCEYFTKIKQIKDQINQKTCSMNYILQKNNRMMTEKLMTLNLLTTDKKLNYISNAKTFMKITMEIILKNYNIQFKIIFNIGSKILKMLLNKLLTQEYMILKICIGQLEQRSVQIYLLIGQQFKMLELFIRTLLKIQQ